MTRDKCTHAAACYSATPMGDSFALFGMGAALVVVAAVSLGGRHSRFGGRALCHLGTLATVIAASVTAALVALAFLGERLAGVADLATFFAWGDLLSTSSLMIVMLFAAMAGLIAGGAGVISPEGWPRLHWHWRRLPRRWLRLERCTSAAAECDGGWREFAGRCLVYGSVAAAILPVLVLNVILTSVDAARVAARVAS